MQPETVRLIIFGVVLISCAMWEVLYPRKMLTQNKWLRWGWSFCCHYSY